MAAYTNRRVSVEPDDPSVVVATGGGNPYAVGTVLIRAGDIIDVGIDWAAWCKANDAKIKSSSWAAHASSPETPTTSGADIDVDRKHTVVIVDASAAAVGDIYFLNNTVVFEDETTGGTYDFPDRTLLRSLKVQVTA